MPVIEDFSNASSRYLYDANLLLEQTRFATADHLFGVSAECALKAIMVALSGTANLPKRYKIHLPNIWDEFIAYMPSSGTNAYASLLAANPFASWDVGDRYGHDTAFTQARVNEHREAALQAQRVLEQARLDGRLI
ncbi:MAG: hypothetical protein ABL911_00270 [Gallionella sp.]|nr:hypothetical protein [Gallionella sp.]